jgi:hypothetical protein
MNTLRISVPVGDLIPAGMRADASTFTTLAYAVKAVAEAAQQQWVAYAMGQSLPSGQTISNRGGTYARSIQLRQTGDFSAEVYSNIPYAHAVEYGEPQRDMKDVLTRSLKVRMVTDPRSPNFGKRYLIIPFRWAASGRGGIGANVMPKAVANWWHGKSASHVVRMSERRSGAGMIDGAGTFHGVHSLSTRAVVHVPQRIYDWGDKLKRGDMNALGIRGVGARSRMQGMVKFDKPKGGGHSQFLTFRTMMEGSSGWIRKAVPGKYPARTVAQQMGPVAEQAFRRAVEEDIAKMLR